MRRAARLCAVIGCGELVRGNDRYCPVHLKERRKMVDAGRPPSSQRGYDREWQQIQKEYLGEHPYCTRCPAMATDVHHKDGNSKNNNFENLESLCHKHHSQVTAHEGGGFGNKRK